MTLHEAFYVARSGRPGPVVVDLPKDVLFATGTYRAPETVERRKSYRPQTEPDPARIAAAADLIAHAKRPLFYGGGGIINSGPQAVQALRRTDRDDRLSLHPDLDGARCFSGGG